MHHHQRGGGGKFDGEIAVGDGIERVLADAVETQFTRDKGAVDREAGAGQRGRAQRQAIHAQAAVGHAFGIARQHFEIGHQVVAEGDRLRHLQMGEAGHDRVGVLLGQVDERSLAGFQAGQNAVDGIAQIQANIGRHLIVA